jgi:orotate phosphoribosyltransferase
MTPPRPAALTPPETIALLESAGALLSGHFRLSSGDHSDRYVQCARATEDPRDASRLGAGIAALFAGGPDGAAPSAPIAAVAAPALGGVVIGHEVARALGVRFVFAERDGATLAFRRGFALRRGEGVLLVEDVLTTGGSVMEVLRLAEEAGAVPAGIGAIVDRTGGGFSPGVPVRALVALAIARYAPGACPLCARGVPVAKPGSRPEAASA